MGNTRPVSDGELDTIPSCGDPLASWAPARSNQAICDPSLKKFEENAPIQVSVCGIYQAVPRLEQIPVDFTHSLRA